MLPEFKTPNLTTSENGSLALAPVLAFASDGTATLDIARELEWKLSFVQSVFIDNSQNTAALDLYFEGVPNAANAQKIRADAYSQGWYPVSWPLGSGRLHAVSAAGVSVPIILANYAMPYLVWGPQDGAAVVPALVNVGLQPKNYAAPGESAIVGAAIGQSIALYRGIFAVDRSCVLNFRDGIGGTILFSALLTPGGSLTFNGSGVPWFATTAGNALVLESTASVNVYGGFGYALS